MQPGRKHVDDLMVFLFRMNQTELVTVFQCLIRAVDLIPSQLACDSFEACSNVLEREMLVFGFLSLFAFQILLKISFEFRSPKASSAAQRIQKTLIR